MIYVCKFGGSSLANATQFEKVKNIVLADERRQAVVVSAPGKRFSGDTKITDLLYLLHAHITYNVDYMHIFDSIKNRFGEIAKDLKISFDVEKEFEDFRQSLTKTTPQEYIVSRGEFFSAKLFAAYSGYHFVDARDVVKFRFDGSMDEELTSRLIKEAFQKYGRIIVPGFYGSYSDGSIRLFSRGGSDITGSIVAKAVNASLYENWTDVSGILVTDPHIIKEPKRIAEITYDELRELSYMGASVLHEETIFPVQELNIPIKILNTNRPEDEGTIIMKECQDKEKLITGIAGKKDFSSFNFIRSRGSKKGDLIACVISIFNKYNVTIEHIPTGIDSFSVIVSTKEVEKFYYDIISELKQLPEILKLDVESGIALVAVVGRNMALKPGTSGKIFGLLGNNNINIRMIAQGSNEINIIVGVNNDDFEKTIEVIYNDCFKKN